jgi:hypothetical protein
VTSFDSSESLLNIYHIARSHVPKDSNLIVTAVRTYNLTIKYVKWEVL